jgi:hypothetical protein
MRITYVKHNQKRVNSLSYWESSTMPSNPSEEVTGDTSLTGLAQIPTLRTMS